MSISQGLKSFVGLLTQGFEQKEDDIFDEMQGDLEYPTQDNLALEPLYGSRVREREERESKVVSHPNFRGYEVIVCEPRSYDQSVNIVKHLKERKTVILNLHLLDKDQSVVILTTYTQIAIANTKHKMREKNQRFGSPTFSVTEEPLSYEFLKSLFIIRTSLVVLDTLDLSLARRSS